MKTVSSNQDSDNTLYELFETRKFIKTLAGFNKKAHNSLVEYIKNSPHHLKPVFNVFTIAEECLSWFLKETSDYWAATLDNVIEGEVSNPSISFYSNIGNLMPGLLKPDTLKRPFFKVELVDNNFVSGEVVYLNGTNMELVKTLLNVITHHSELSSPYITFHMPFLNKVMLHQKLIHKVWKENDCEKMFIDILENKVLTRVTIDYLPIIEANHFISEVKKGKRS